MRLIITLSILAFMQLFFNVAEAAPHRHVNATAHKSARKPATDDNRRKRKPLKTATKRSKQPQPHKIKEIPQKNLPRSRSTQARKLAQSRMTQKKYYSSQKVLARHKIRIASPHTAAMVISATHHQKYQKARQTAMNKLMNQLGKPYQWGGTSPHTGFDCSGLVYYAYKDLVKFKIPRTANEMYHLRDAAPVKRDSLQKGDLVFFRIHHRGAADHVGVYVGNGKFIQSPRTGKDIQITDLTGEYWQKHYIGARRMMTPNSVR
ncbi:endopeptidase [Rosenbergiella australiborealis]|uniref:Endopeptidase n=1 Tax=Rosenbergiella australiborealis TaxID=1544696 RepID=A0ABS5T2E1_9GAMM|nr:C40 family peptidase [Rosenbergiella australiborealis]MBT0726505.1 endopeptidase [Rosenbergiella australiborealis]